MKHYCNQPACPNEAVYRGMCAQHGRQSELSTHDAGRKRFYNSAMWKAFRLRRLAANPFCACGAVAVDVDHILPMEQGGTPFSVENTDPKCKACHGRKTMTERQGMKLVYVCGPPCSGKTTYVATHRMADDPVVDLDAIKSALMLRAVDHPQASPEITRLALIAAQAVRASMNYGWIIQTERRDGPNVITMQTSREECLRRARNRPNPSQIIPVIEEWFERGYGR